MKNTQQTQKNKRKKGSFEGHPEVGFVSVVDFFSGNVWKTERCVPGRLPLDQKKATFRFSLSPSLPLTSKTEKHSKTIDTKIARTHTHTRNTKTHKKVSFLNWKKHSFGLGFSATQEVL